jgi:hypothetical protein
MRGVVSIAFLEVDPKFAALCWGILIIFFVACKFITYSPELRQANFLCSSGILLKNACKEIL